MASLGSIQQELVTMQSNTAVNKAKEQAANGPSQELDGDAFLMLMMEQLKNQDPMDPMDNSEMLAQQAQFSQLQELQELNDTINTNNMIQQANSLVGKTVQVVDPNNTSRLITGVVTSANFTSGAATVTVNGKEYPLGLVASITDGAQPSDSNTIANKKLSELNNINALKEGYITVTVQGDDYKKQNTFIKITSDMTVKDLQKEIEKSGLKTSIENGILTIQKGDNKSISITQGKIGDSSAASSNLIEAMEIFQSETGDLETAVLDFNRTNSSASNSGSSSTQTVNNDAANQSILERILNKIFD